MSQSTRPLSADAIAAGRRVLDWRSSAPDWIAVSLTISAYGQSNVQLTVLTASPEAAVESVPWDVPPPEQWSERADKWGTWWSVDGEAWGLPVHLAVQTAVAS